MAKPASSCKPCCSNPAWPADLPLVYLLFHCSCCCATPPALLHLLCCCTVNARYNDCLGHQNFGRCCCNECCYSGTASVLGNLVLVAHCCCIQCPDNEHLLYLHSCCTDSWQPAASALLRPGLSASLLLPLSIACSGCASKLIASRWSAASHAETMPASSTRSPAGRRSEA